MTTSGSYDLPLAADDVLTDAWERIGKNTAEITGDVARSARRSIEQMLVDWTNRGLNLWQTKLDTLTLAVGTSSYVLEGSNVELLSASVIGTDGIERTLAPIGRNDYAAIPNKAQAGTPTQYFCHRALFNPTLHLYPTPDAALTLSFWQFRQPQLVGALGNHVDAPFMWSDALCAGLAARLATKFAPDRLVFLVPQAETALLNASRENRQRVNLRLLPNFGR